MLGSPASPTATANTFLVVEARNAVPWTKPADLPFDPEAAPSLNGAGSSARTRAASTPRSPMAASASSSSAINLDLFRALITREMGDALHQWGRVLKSDGERCRLGLHSWLRVDIHDNEHDRKPVTQTGHTLIPAETLEFHSDRARAGRDRRGRARHCCRAVAGRTIHRRASAIAGSAGVAKTLLVATLSKRSTFGSQIQFTVDLLPSDIMGWEILDQRANDFRVHKGRFLQICCWPARSTAPPPRCRRLIGSDPGTAGDDRQ